MAIPTAPTINAIGRPGFAQITVSALAANVPTAYEYQAATNNTFTTGVVSILNGDASGAGADMIGLTPGTLYYFRARARNASGTGAYSGTVTATVPARRALDVVEGASLVVSGGVQVSLRFTPATGVVQLGYSALLDATAWTVIATIDTAADFFVTGSIHDFALVANPAGDLYVVGAGRNAAAPTSQTYVRARRYTRTGTTTWAVGGTAIQTGPGAAGGSVFGFTAIYVLGSGGTPIDSIAVTMRNARALNSVSGAYATLDVAAINASGATLFIASGLGNLVALSGGGYQLDDLALVTPTGTLLVGVDGAVTTFVRITNGVRSFTVSPTFNSFMGSGKLRTLTVDANTVAIVGVIAGDLVVKYVGTNGLLLGTATYAAANAFGGAFVDQWDAYYNPVTGAVRVYYVADNAGARQLEYVDAANTTYLVGAPVVVSAAVGAVGSTNNQVRVPRFTPDQRRVLVALANIAAGVHSTVGIDDRSGNQAPNAPALIDEVGYDATAARNFGWAFSDPDAGDTQTAYELVIERVSDGVAIVSTGKVVSTALTRNVAGGTLTNAVNYRWRVRTYDALDQVGAWSAYDTFTTAATGTLTITLPVADTALLDVATYDVTWTYVQVNGYVQTQRRVKVVRVSDGATLSDTTMQASTVAHYVVSLPTGVAVRIEVSIVTNAPGTPTIGPVLRLVTSNYSDPMPPTAVLTVLESYITITVTNPAPSGSRPEVVSNLIERRDGGTADDFVAIASVPYGGSYDDHAVRSGRAYEYRVRGIS